MSDLPTEPTAAVPELVVPATGPIPDAAAVPAAVAVSDGAVAAPAEAEPVEAMAAATGPATAVSDVAEPAAAESAAATPTATAPDAAPPEPRGPGPAAVATLLAERFPAVFAPGQARPLKLRIQADIQQRLPVAVSRKVLSVVLQRHTTSTAYLRAMAVATQRFDLDGQPAGELAEEHRAAAQAEVQRRHALFAERRAAERAAQRERERDRERAAQAQAHAQREAEGAERAARASLLRAFETTTLTRANFCALKSVADAELDALLARARAERAERLAAPRPSAPSPGAAPAQRPDRPQGADRPDRGERPDRPERPRGARPARAGKPGPRHGAPR